MCLGRSARTPSSEDSNQSWCPVVHGDYGVGKTTMVRRYFHAEERHGLMRRAFARVPKKGRVVYFSSAAGLSVSKVFETVLDHLEYRVEIDRSVAHGSAGTLGFSDGAFLSATRSRSKQATSRLVVTSPTDEGMLRIINDARLTIIIDELHTASDDFRRDLVPFIKASRVSARRSNLVLIGTASDASTLVASDPGIDRYITDNLVNTMSDNEARTLVESGFRKLGMAVPEAIVLR